MSDWPEEEATKLRVAKAEIVALSVENTRLRARIQEAAVRASKRARITARLLKACKSLHKHWRRECLTQRVHYDLR